MEEWEDPDGRPAWGVGLRPFDCAMAGSNPVEIMDVCLLCLLCVV